MLKTVTTQNLDDKYKICFPENYTDVDLSSPALEIFTDFRLVRPLMLESDVPIDDALALMKRAHVKLKIVIDKSEHMIGAISFSDLSGEKPIKMTLGRRGRREVLVSDIMIPRKELKSLSMVELRKSSIGEIIKLLKDEHTNHIFVIDTEKLTIRGLVSASDITRKLNLPLSIDVGPSFHRIFSVL